MTVLLQLNEHMYVFPLYIYMCVCVCVFVDVQSSLRQNFLASLIQQCARPFQPNVMTRTSAVPGSPKSDLQWMQCCLLTCRIWMMMMSHPT